MPFFSACSIPVGQTLRGNHQIVNEEIAIGDYHSILLTMSAEVIYRQIAEEAPFLQVSVDENLLPLIDIEVHNGRLVIGQKEPVNISPSRFVIYTNSRSLSGISVTGSGDVLLEKAVNARSMDISVTGSGDVRGDSLFCERLGVKITGSGDVSLQGAATDASFSVTGSGDISCFNYLVENLDCRVSGSGDIDARVGKTLRARISGSGDIRYMGDPARVDQKVSGSGDILRIGESD